MPNPRSHLLCITLTPGSAHLVEARRGAEAVQVLRRSTLALTDETGLSQPAALGAALAEHIKAQGYTTRHAAIGLCPRWVLTRHKQVPPADAETLRGIVNLQIEREFAGGAAEIAFDYLVGEAASGQANAPLILAGVRSAVLAQVKQASLAAGLRIEAITPTTLAAADRDGTVVFVEDGIAGVMRVSDGRVLAMSSFSVDTAALHDEPARSQLVSGLARCLLQLPGADGDTGLTLILPLSVAEADAKRVTDAVRERFGSVDARQADAAELLAIHATHAEVALIDFNAPRLAPPRRQRLSTRTKWGLRAALVAVLVIGGVTYLWMDATARRDALQAELDGIRDTAEQLDTTLAHARHAETWFEDRPPTLDSMLALTRTFPSEGEIRVETLTLSEANEGLIDCAAEDRRTMDDYFERMQSFDTLREINRGGVRPSGGSGTWIDFPIAFRFDASAARGGD